MKEFLALFLVVFLASEQNIDTGNRRKVRSALCTAPVMTHRWAVSNDTNTCSGGSACTNGAGIDTVIDLGSASPSLAEQGSALNRPIFTAAVLNGNAVATFTPASSQNFILHNAISDELMTVYVILKPTTGTFFGGGNTGTAGSVQYFFNGTNQRFNNLNKAIIATGTSALSTTSFQTIALTYNFSTGAAQLFKCAAGTCASDGTGTVTGGFGFPITRIGGESVPGFFGGQIAEVGYTNVISTAGIAAYSQCQYGI